MWARWPTEGHNGALLGCGVGGISAGTRGLGRVRRRLGKMGGSDTQLHAAEGERERDRLLSCGPEEESGLDQVAGLSSRVRPVRIRNLILDFD
jgi:hypothetical protein